MRPDGPRPTIIGLNSGPDAPFPLRMKGKVVSGFGRGSKEVRPIILSLGLLPLPNNTSVTHSFYIPFPFSITPQLLLSDEEKEKNETENMKKAT